MLQYFGMRKFGLLKKMFDDDFRYSLGGERSLSRFDDVLEF